MSTVLLVLKIIGIVLLCLLGLLLLLLLIPVTLEAGYTGAGLLLKVRYGLITLTLADPERKKARKEKKKKPEKQEAAPEEQPQQKPKSDIPLGLIFKLIKPGFGALKSIVKSLKIRDVHIHLVASGDESDEVGISAGRTWAALGAVITAANNIWDNIEYSELSVVPDFTAQHQNDEKIGCKVTAFPIIIVYIAIVFLVRFLHIKRQEQKKHGDANKRGQRAKKEKRT